MKSDWGYAIQTSMDGTVENIHYLLSMFNCQNCGKCCRECTDGTYLQPHEISPLVKKLRLTKKAFTQQYCSVRDGHVFIKQPCLLRKKRRCLIYSLRPQACYLFPIALDPETRKIRISCCLGGMELLSTLGIK